MTDLPDAIVRLNLPPQWPESLLDGIAAHNRLTGSCIIVLDDDPLGGQAIHDVPVLMAWTPELLAREIKGSDALLVVTNTRSLDRDEAMARAREVGFALREAEARTGRAVTPVWRSDSTLRGHFWWEMRAFHEGFRPDLAPPTYVFLPYFGDGGRYTIGDTQYVRQGDDLVPASQSEFGKDPAFAYKTSHLPAWLETHTSGGLPAHRTIGVSLDDIRTGGPARVGDLLRPAPESSVVVVNAVAERDLEVFVAALQAIEAEGRAFACTGAAPFVRVRIGQKQHPPSAPKLGPRVSGGLTIVGSYVDKTSAQLAHAAASASVETIDVVRTAVTAEVARTVDEHIKAGCDVVLHTPRQFRAEDAVGFRDALNAIVNSLRVEPRYVLVKGGSTASQVATEAFGVQRAVVSGQLLAGVPIWRLGEESRWPGLPFVIFAGNVGSEGSLTEALKMLRGE